MTAEEMKLLERFVVSQEAIATQMHRRNEVELKLISARLELEEDEIAYRKTDAGREWLAAHRAANLVQVRRVIRA